jgi:hypothetical protein
MKNVSYFLALAVLVIVAASCQKNDPPSPYTRVTMNQVQYDKSLGGVSVILAKEDSSVYKRTFTVVYDGEVIAQANYFEAQFDIDVRVGTVSGATLISVIARPDFCAEMFIISQGKIESHSIEIRAEHNPETFFTPYVFYAPGELRLNDSGNPSATPKIVIPVKF